MLEKLSYIAAHNYRSATTILLLDLHFTADQYSGAMSSLIRVYIRIAIFHTTLYLSIRVTSYRYLQESQFKKLIHELLLV